MSGMSGRTTAAFTWLIFRPWAMCSHRACRQGWVHATLEHKGIQLELRCVDHTHKCTAKSLKLQWRAG